MPPNARGSPRHGADEHAHRDGEDRRQDPSQQKGRPPSGGEARVRFRQDAEELPFLTLGQSLKHDRILPQNRSAHGFTVPAQPSDYSDHPEQRDQPTVGKIGELKRA